MSVPDRAAETLPDEILRKIVSYVPGKISIHKTGWKEFLRRLEQDAIFRSRFFKTDKDLYCSFRGGKNKLKTPPAMTYEDAWYGACHMVILPLQNKNDPMGFRATRWAQARYQGRFAPISYSKLHTDKIFFEFRDCYKKTIYLDG